MKKNTEAQVLRLWKAYQEIKIRPLQHQSLSVASGFIISACNPQSKVLSNKLNRLRTQKLQRYLQHKNIQHQYLLVGNPDFSWSEPSYVVQLPQTLAVNLARLYQQNAIYRLESGTIFLVPVLLAGLQETCLGYIEQFSI